MSSMIPNVSSTPNVDGRDLDGQLARDEDYNLHIPGTDLTIYGTLRSVPDGPLVVFSHDLAGDRNGLKYYAAARALSAVGIGSYRFNYYDAEPDARNLVDCTIDDHVTDLDVAVAHFKKRNPGRPVAVVGHSLGGLTILLSRRQQFDAVALWDASHPAYWGGEIENDMTVWEPALGLLRLRWGIDILVGRQLFESFRFLDGDALISQLVKPLLVVVAGEGVKQDIRRRYYDNAQLATSRELVVVDGADHQFTNTETLATLITETTSWLKDTFSNRAKK